MDNRKKGGAGTPTGGGSYEMLDRNAQNQYGADPSAPPMAQPQPHYAQHNQDNVSRSDLDVLETNHGAEPYGYNVYPGYHNPAEPAAPYPAPPYPADAGVGYFQ
ncbi:hypothetical protein IW139_006692, partial [Coemansia sp. RSA 353]